MINMSKTKKSKSEAECGEGSSCSSNTGGGIIETFIIHFPDVHASNTIVSLYNIENPSECLEKLNDIRRRLEPQGSLQRMTDICSQVPSTYSKEQLYGYHRQCYQRFTGNLHRLQASAFLEAEPSTSRPKRRSSTEKYISPQNVFFVAKIASVRLRKVAYGLQNHFPNSNMVEEPQYLKQLKTVVTFICSEKFKVMIYLLVRLSIIDHVIKNTSVNQLILVWTLI